MKCPDNPILQAVGYGQQSKEDTGAWLRVWLTEC